MDTKHSTHRSFNRKYVNITGMILILAIALSVTGTVHAEIRSPYIQAFPDRDHLEGRESFLLELLNKPRQGPDTRAGNLPLRCGWGTRILTRGNPCGARAKTG